MKSISESAAVRVNQKIKLNVIKGSVPFKTKHCVISRKTKESGDMRKLGNSKNIH